ncbi:hypothetical protein B0H11DRAFT_2185965 [Mycena galericulata]|nr:hypothetical protein B0H11DRAFT_2185965 [Mycena galericulata]
MNIESEQGEIVDRRHNILRTFNSASLSRPRYNLGLFAVTDTAVDLMGDNKYFARARVKIEVPVASLAKRGIRSPVRLPAPKSGIPEIPEPLLQRAQKHPTPARTKNKYRAIQKAIKKWAGFSYQVAAVHIVRPVPDKFTEDKRNFVSEVVVSFLRQLLPLVRGFSPMRPELKECLRNNFLTFKWDRSCEIDDGWEQAILRGLYVDILPEFIRPSGHPWFRNLFLNSWIKVQVRFICPLPLKLLDEPGVTSFEGVDEFMAISSISHCRTMPITRGDSTACINDTGRPAQHGPMNVPCFSTRAAHTGKCAGVNLVPGLNRMHRVYRGMRGWNLCSVGDLSIPKGK